MRLDQPLFLLLVPALFWFWRAAPGHTSRWRRHARLACVALVMLALSGLEISGGDAPLSITYVLDRSHSAVTSLGEFDAVLSRTSDAMRRADRAGLVVFGAEPIVERVPAASFATDNGSSVVPGGGTNIAAALRAGRSTLPENGSRRLVLLSDGLQTAGDALDEAANAAAAGVPIDVVIPTSRTPESIDVVRVSAPPTARLGEPLEIVVSARGKAGTRGIVTLRAGAEVRRQTVTVPSEGILSVAFAERATHPGAQVYEAGVEVTGDFAVSQLSHGAVVAVMDQPRVLYVGRDPAAVRTPLERSGFDFSMRAPASLPRVASSLTDYDVILLDDVAGETLDSSQRNALASYTQQHGGGVVFLGGPESIEAGQLTSDPLGDMLPIDFRPRSGQRAPRLALVIVFDKSGSMDDRVAGVPRIEFARQAVRRVFESVPGSDAIGVIAFDTQPHAVAPLRAAQDLRSITSGLATVQPGGGTAISPALEAASEWLADTSLPPSVRRHVLLVSDGHTSPADAARVRELARRGVFELSVVALGADAERSFLGELAAMTNGRAYFPSDIRDLPALAARESVRVSGGGLVNRPFQPRALDHPVLNGIDTATLPSLGGYVVGAAKPLAQVVLQSPLGDPVLATIRAGLGRVAIYTSDLHSSWSARLLEWDEFPRLIAQTARWTSRRVRDELLYAEFVAAGDDLRLVVEAQRPDGRFISGLECDAVVRGPDGATTKIGLMPTSPGRYEARLSAPEPGAYVMEIAASNRDLGVDSRIIRGTYWSSPAEYRRSGVDTELLGRIAAVSGGRVLAAAENPFNAPRDSDYVRGRSWLIGGALLAFLFEVLLPSWRRRAATPNPVTQRQSARTAAA